MKSHILHYYKCFSLSCRWILELVQFIFIWSASRLWGMTTTYLSSWSTFPFPGLWSTSLYCCYKVPRMHLAWFYGKTTNTAFSPINMVVYIWENKNRFIALQFVHRSRLTNFSNHYNHQINILMSSIVKKPKKSSFYLWLYWKLASLCFLLC